MGANEKIVRLGGGAGYSGDRIDPAVDLSERGQLHYLVFECLAERTIAIAVKARRADPEGGYDPYLEERMRAVLGACARGGVTIVTNMGAANPVAAARHTAQIARELGLQGLKIAAITGDDVLEAVIADELTIVDGDGLTPTDPRIVSANAYLGAEPIAQALAAGAQVVITGRVADPSLFLGPLMHEFGWAADDWDRLGAGTVIGHLLECAGQITGGYYADGGDKVTPGLADLGFPIAEVRDDGSAIVTKLAGTGGAVTLSGVKEQLLYEIHDPTRYLTPDVAADFTGVRLEALGMDRVAVRGGRGFPRPATLKVSVGYDDGFIGEGQISYAGPGAVARGRLALDVVAKRLARLEFGLAEQRLDLIGVDAVGVASPGVMEPWEVRARVAVRAARAADAAWAGREIEALYTNGPAGGGGATQSVRAVVAVASAFIDRARVTPRLTWETA